MTSRACVAVVLIALRAARQPFRWTLSSFLLCDGLYALFSQTKQPYVRIGLTRLTYIHRQYFGLRPQFRPTTLRICIMTMLAFRQTFSTCGVQQSLLSKVTPRYLNVSTISTCSLLMITLGGLSFLFLVKTMSLVFDALKLRPQLAAHASITLASCCKRFSIVDMSTPVATSTISSANALIMLGCISGNLSRSSSGSKFQ